MWDCVCLVRCIISWLWYSHEKNITWKPCWSKGLGTQEAGLDSQHLGVFRTSDTQKRIIYHCPKLLSFRAFALKAVFSEVKIIPRQIILASVSISMSLYACSIVNTLLLIYLSLVNTLYLRELERWLIN